MQRFYRHLLCASLLLTGVALSAHAQTTINIDATTFVTSVGLGPGGGVPFIASWPNDPDPAPWTQHVEDIQPGSYVEYVVTTTTPGLYSIDVLGMMASDDPPTQFSIESRPYSSPEDPYVTRYTTPDSKEYPRWGAWGSAGIPRTYIPTGKLEDANFNVLTIPLFEGQNIVRLRNISQRHQAALSYPVDYTAPGATVRPMAGRWNNLHFLQITLTREGNLPSYGTVTGTVTGNKPAGVKVRRAWVMANPPGTSPVEPSSWWRWGYNTLTKDDGTYVLRAPVGQQEIKAGRPSSYDVRGSTPIAVNVPATGSATANPTLTSLFMTQTLTDDTAYIQAEYFDFFGGAGRIGLVGDDNARNHLKMGWVDAGDSVSMIVDVPQAGNYEVTSHYSNGGGEGRTRVSTDLGQSVEIVQPNEGWATQSARTATGTIYLPAGPNTITQTNLAPNSDFDAVVLRRLDTPVTVGFVHGLVTDSLTGQPVANATVTIGSSTITTDATGNYRILVNGATNIPYTFSAPFQEAPVTGTVTVPVSGDVTLNTSITIRPHLTLSTANGFNWLANYNTGGTADFSAVAAPETEFTDPVTLPGRWDLTAPQDDIYGWYRLHFTVPANFGTQIPGRMAVLTATGVDEIDAMWVNGTLVGQTGSFPTTPLGVQPTGFTNPPDNLSATEEYPGLGMRPQAARAYYFPLSLLKPGQDNVIAVKVFDHQGDGGLTSALNLEIAPAVATVTGSVKAGATGVPGVRVGVSDATTAITVASALTDASGNYTIIGATPGAMVVSAARPGYLPAAQALNVAAGASHVINLTTTAVTDGPAPLYDDFSDGPNGWMAKWDAISIINNTTANAPYVTEPGFDANIGPTATIPSTITVEGSLAERGGILSKARFSRFASVNSAKLVSALSSTPEPTGGLPNAILQLKGNIIDDDPTQANFSNWIEFVLEGYSTQNGEQRVRYNIFGNGPRIGYSAVPIPLARLGDITPTNAVEMTITRVGSYYDFFINGTRIFDHNIPVNNMVDHKIFLYSFQIASPLTWDWVKASSATLAPAPLAKATQALRIAGGLEASPATGVSFTALNVATNGDSATKIDLLDAVALAKQGQ